MMKLIIQGDGGVYAQILRNNGLQGSSPDLTAYAAVGGSTLSVDTTNPFTDELPRSIEVTASAESVGLVGLENEGYWGIPVPAQTFNTSFYLKGAYTGDVVLRLTGASSGTVFAEQNVTVSSTDSEFSGYTALLTSNAAPDGDNVWQLLFDGSKIAGSSVNVALVQLFPPTFKNRYNGLREDIAEALNALGGSFLRYPGGSNLQGSSVETRWKWNETIGPLEHRPGRNGLNKIDTDGLGLVEFMLWCQDMSLEPLLVVWSGLPFGGGAAVTGTDLEPYIEEAVAALDFLMGDASTEGGILRTSLGYPDPFPVKYVEIGNEDFSEAGCANYPDRLIAFRSAILEKYPNMVIIASVDQADCLPSTLPDDLWLDPHRYLAPQGLVDGFNAWDNADRAHGIFVGEYAAMYNDDGTQLVRPHMMGSCAEAVYMIGMERNSDVVKMASYAPLLEHFGHTNWTPNLIGFNATAGSVTRSTSYFVQQMFASNRGSTIREVSSDVDFGPVYWVASVDDTDAYFVKLANFGEAEQDVTVNIEGKVSGELTILSGGALQSNEPLNEVVTPSVSALSGDGVFSFSIPAYGVAIISA
ncbi:hypothetical protein MAP00_004958 [Neofusicoccum parvum]|nr:hypothetical protein MAP00_004958 [Neofusicoccum parvum]